MMGPWGKLTKLIVKKKLFSISVTLHRFECIPIFVISEKVLGTCTSPVFRGTCAE